jgi:hypothetical protein
MRHRRMVEGAHCREAILGAEADLIADALSTTPLAQGGPPSLRSATQGRVKRRLAL